MQNLDIIYEDQSSRKSEFHMALPLFLVMVLFLGMSAFMLYKQAMVIQRLYMERARYIEYIDRYVSESETDPVVYTSENGELYTLVKKN